MKKKIIILSPRTDLSFKKSKIIVSPSPGKPLNYIKRYWDDFVEIIESYCRKMGHDVKIIRKPMWKFTLNYAKEFDFDKMFVPHHCYKTFDPKTKLPNVNYYMQMVFPWLFQIDHKGWCADASIWPIKPSSTSNGDVFKEYQKLIFSGYSKIKQPNRQKIKFNFKYILFLCQITHDLTIKLHSKVSVLEALKRTIRFAKEININIIVKPHPGNPLSMREIYLYVSELNQNGHQIIWANNLNIHDLIEQSEAVFSVNSGGGMESILHNKPVFCFGKADYASISHFIKDGQINWQDRNIHIHNYANFFDSYVNSMIDVRKKNSQEDHLKRYFFKN